MSTLSSIFRYYLSKDKTQRAEEAKHMLAFLYGNVVEGRENTVLSQYIMRRDVDRFGWPNKHGTTRMPTSDMMRVFAAVANKYGGKV